MKISLGVIFLERILFVFKTGPGDEMSLFRQSVERDTKMVSRDPALINLSGKSA